MSLATLHAPVASPPGPMLDEQRLDLGGISWDRYTRIADAIPDHAGTRTIFLDGRLTFMTTSRRHDALADALSDLVKAVAVGTRVGFAVGGRATYRQSEQGAGVEGDQTFYFGENARRMRGNINIDLATQPPPDLAIEVEVANPAELSIAAWGRLGVPEVWHFKVDSWTLTFLSRQADGSYLPSARSLGLPTLTPEDVTAQLRISEEIDTSDWYEALRNWVREVLILRQAGGG